MKYYELMCIESEEKILQSSVQELKNGAVVVVGHSYGDVVTAKVIKEIDEYTALVSGDEIPKIIQVVDLKEFYSQRKAKAQKSQIERIMKGKIEEIKMIEQMEKFAGKDSDFGILLETYKALGNN